MLKVRDELEELYWAMKRVEVTLSGPEYISAMACRAELLGEIARWDAAHELAITYHEEVADAEVDALSFYSPMAKE